MYIIYSVYSVYSAYSAYTTQSILKKYDGPLDTCVVVHVLGAAGAASEEDAASTGGTGEKEGRKDGRRYV